MGLTPVVRSFLGSAWLAVAALGGLAATSAAPARAAEDMQQRGTELVAKAARLEDLLSPDTGRFLLRVHVKLFGLVAGLREGEVTLGAKAYPRTLRCFEGKELAVEATVVELAPDSGVQAEDSFAAPAGAERWPECATPTPPG